MPDVKRRLLLLINSLEGGGAERIMVRLAEALPEHMGDWEFHLGLLDDVADAYPPPPTVELHRLDSRGSFVRSIRGTRKLVAEIRPDVVLSFLTRANCAAVLAMSRGGYRCVISERVNTTSHFGVGLRAALQRRMVVTLYPRADAVVAVSQGVADELRKAYRVPPDRLMVIRNPVDGEALRAAAAEAVQVDLPEDFFVSVGRLVPNKGGETLLRAFAAHRNRQRCLVLLGEGPERARLENLADGLGIADRVIMPGYVSNPYAIVARATAYVSASRSEGFPNALVEAMALGCAVAATDCQSGPAEILAETQTSEIKGMVHAKWGLLVPVDDVASMTEAMDVLDDPAMRADLAEKSLTRAQGYDAASVVRDYVGVLRIGKT